MALSGQKTTADYIEWEKLQSLILKLERDSDNFALLLSIGSYTRTALAMKLSHLQEVKEVIMDALEDRFNIDDPEEVFRILEAAVIFAGYNGLIEMTTMSATSFVDVYGMLPKHIQCNLLNSPSAKKYVLDSFNKA